MKEVRSIQSSLILEEEKERMQEVEGDHKYHDKEMEMKAKFDDQAAKVAERYGLNYEELPWLEITKGVTLVYLILTMLCMW